MIYNIFTSHSWSYGDQYERFFDLLESHGFSYKNYSVPKDDPIHDAENTKELETAIREQIKHASCVLVLAGVYASYSKWMKIEVRMANIMGKPIIAVEPWGSEKTSKFVRDNADETVGWRAESIIDAIKRHCK